MTPSLLQRKDGNGFPLYDSPMMESGFPPQVMVAEVLSSHPVAVSVFLRHRMACVGCLMARFETLEDAARVYGVPLDELCIELAGVESSQQCRRME